MSSHRLCDNADGCTLSSMDNSAKIVAFVGTRNPQRAKDFYRDTLGLNLVSEDPFALVFDVNGTMLRVTPVPELTPAKFTVLGWAGERHRGGGESTAKSRRGF